MAAAGSSASRWTRRPGYHCRSPWPGHRRRVVRGHAVLRDYGRVRAALDEPAHGGRRPQPGAKLWTVFRRVTLPLIWPSLAAGTVLTWARALGEFGATITFAGNLPGRTQTMPLAIYISQSSGKLDEAIALSLVLVVVSLVVMIFRRRIAGGD